MNEDLPVVVIGAGPQGLAAAAHLLERGLEPLVLEAGCTPAAAVAEWGHVRLFSAWPELVDAASARLLAQTGWTAPASGYPTGSAWVAQYLAPLAGALGDRVRLGQRVTAVNRLGRDRLAGDDRATQPFVVHVTDADGIESRITARAVVDASGTWSQPNPAGADGVPALGERTAGPRVSYRVPDVAAPQAFSGRHTVVIGSGHSAASAVNALAELAGSVPRTRVTWVLRRASVGDRFGGGDADRLPERGALGARAKAAVDAGVVEMLTGFRVERLESHDRGAVVHAEDGRATAVADRVLVLTGFRPDLSFLSEIRLDLDTALQAPSGLAGEIDPSVHTCGTVAATGARELAQPERDFYLIGAKSYGRAPTFLALTGYEQVRSVVAALAGDDESAARKELHLPETGVCSGAGDPGADGAACCAPTRQPIQLGRLPLPARV